MFRPTTLFTILLAAALGFSLFLLKYEVQSLEDELIALDKTLINDRQAIHVLKAEWSLLNDPERLRVLSEKYLGLKPLSASQVITENNLDTVLPEINSNDGSAQPSATAQAEAASRKINVRIVKGSQP